MARLSAEEAADRLGVKVATVYAYVSRGHLRSRHEPGSRRSSFDGDEVEALARRGRPRRTTRPPALDFVIETSLTSLGEDDVRYRGRSALGLARTAAFEEVAEWLWTGHDATAFKAWSAASIDVVDLPGARDRLRLAVVLASAADPLRADPGPAAVTARARSLIATMTAAVGGTSRAARLQLPEQPEAIRGTIAGRLWGALTTKRATPESVVALNGALVLLADHELAASTLVARVAASARADPYAVVLAGMGPLAGPLHGGASMRAVALLEVARNRGPEAALTQSFETLRYLPGFGHRVHVDGDPRAKVLLNLVRQAYPGHPTLDIADRLVATVRRRAQLEPNTDLVLAVFALAAGMPADAGETIFTIARSAGWIAHALEEFSEAPQRFRARAVPRRSPR